jgi:hypothetical protein
MTITTILLLLLSLIVASGLSYYQYFYKAKNKSKLNLFLALLRFLSLFGIILLLINPIITRNTLEIIKPSLAIVVDNSSSITALDASKKALEVYDALVSNSALKEKFEIQSYRFDMEFEPSEQFDFQGTQTNLGGISKELGSRNRNNKFPTILLTDGNQTSGNDYIYSFDETNKVFPIVLGDTTKIVDLKISQINVNKYAFFKNKFPVEVFLNYSGDKNLSADFTIAQGNSILAKQSIAFSSSKKTAVLNVLLPANKIGSIIFKASISSAEKEKNTYNNSKNFAVEVIDQKTKIALVTAINHPDVAALKRSIESNAQRTVTIVKPNAVNSLKEYDVLILYQPNIAFKRIFEENTAVRLPTFIITGTTTDFPLLNQQQSTLVFKMSNQKENYLAGFNSQFNLFVLDNIGFENFAPLENTYGNITVKGNASVLLSSKIRSIETNSPLLLYAENQGNRSVFLLGENIWKWRLQSHIDSESFAEFDVFMDKTIQYLASSSSKKALVVSHESFYNSGDAIEITAQYFNKNYEFDDKARLTIIITNIETKQTKNYDLLKGNNFYKVNLDGLVAGAYNFSVKELNSNTSYSGHFEILDFDREKQFVNPDLEKLSQLATQTKGVVYFPNQVDALIKSLLKDDNYKAIEKNRITRSPLIDWTLLLILIVSLLSTEWFVRKYNGLL